MFDAITFDLWNTLLGSPALGGAARHEARVHALQNALRARGDDVERTTISDLMRREWSHYNAVWEREVRTMLNAERVRWMTDELGLDRLDRSTEADVATAFDASLWEGPPPLADGARDVLRMLRETGVRIGVVSDTSFSTGRTMRRLLDEYDVLDFFEPAALVFSDEVGASKPAVDLFERAFGALETDPRRGAHIGDNPRTDVKGARDAGAFAIYFGPDPPASSDLDVADFAAFERWFRETWA